MTPRLASAASAALLALWLSAPSVTSAQVYYIEGIDNPPGQINRIADIRLANPDFEAAEAPKERFPGWGITQHAGDESYEWAVDRDERASGRQSLRVRRIKEQVYAKVDQRILVARELLDGATLDLSGMFRTREADGAWMPIVTFYTTQNAIIRQVRGEPVSGTSDWVKRTIRVEIPRGTRIISVGALFLGGGTAWLDDVALRIEPRRGGEQRR